MDASMIDQDTDGAAMEPSIWPMVRHVFRRWELLRIVFNAVLIVESVFFLFATTGWRTIPPWWVVVQAIFAAIGANVSYLLGPTVESYLAWLGFRNGMIRYALFMVGTAFSVLVVAAVFVTIEFGLAMQQYYFQPPVPQPAPPLGPI